MTFAASIPSSARILHWIARIWSLLVFAIGLLIAISPDPYETEPVPAADWFLLSLWGAAILGLLAGWPWELAGGIIGLACMLVREISWIILHGAL